LTQPRAFFVFILCGLEKKLKKKKQKKKKRKEITNKQQRKIEFNFR